MCRERLPFVSRVMPILAYARAHRLAYRYLLLPSLSMIFTHATTSIRMALQVSLKILYWRSTQSSQPPFSHARLRYFHARHRAYTSPSPDMMIIKISIHFICRFLHARLRPGQRFAVLLFATLREGIALLEIFKIIDCFHFHQDITEITYYTLHL